MTFTIEILGSNSVTAIHNKDAFLKEISKMIDDFITSEGTLFQIEVDSNAAVFQHNRDTGWKKTVWGERITSHKIP